MASIPTVEIVSPKDNSVMWKLNESDFDPAVHTLWADRDNAKPMSIPFASERRMTAAEKAKAKDEATP